jgi:hypothetical protein
LSAIPFRHVGEVDSPASSAIRAWSGPGAAGPRAPLQPAQSPSRWRPRPRRLLDRVGRDVSKSAPRPRRSPSPGRGAAP